MRRKIYPQIHDTKSWYASIQYFEALTFCPQTKFAPTALNWRIVLSLSPLLKARSKLNMAAVFKVVKSVAFDFNIVSIDFDLCGCEVLVASISDLTSSLYLKSLHWK